MMFSGMKPAQASQSQLRILEALLDDPAVDQVTLLGENFDNGNDPIVLLGTDPNPLVAQLVSAAVLVIDLPVGLAPGNYLVSVSTGN